MTGPLASLNANSKKKFNPFAYSMLYWG